MVAEVMLMKGFQPGQSSLEVCKIILKYNPGISIVRLIAHEVEGNWRQNYRGSREKLENLLCGFEHRGPNQDKIYSADNFDDLFLEGLYGLGESQVWSITSKVACSDKKYRHIPMMNFHPEVSKKKALKPIKETLQHICGNRPGVLLDSGRFFHYYGNFLLEENEWIGFMAEFLMPCVLVSPRYIGHRLQDGFCSLRLTSDKEYKPTVPRVIEVL